MKKHILIVLVMLTSITTLPARDFVTHFLDKCVEDERPVNNINIGKMMLTQMADNTDDENLKDIFSHLSYIRIVTSENREDSEYYFEKAIQLAAEDFREFNEVVSLNEQRGKVNILMKKTDEKNQDIILISLDDNNNLMIVTLAGRIDLKSLSKLSDTLNSKSIPTQ